MPQNWLLRFSNESTQLKDFDPERFKFENDKKRMDEFFESYGYKILIVDITKPESHQYSNKEIYRIGSEFFLQHKVFENHASNSPNNMDKTPFMLEIYDKIVMGLMCIKDVIQEIGQSYYINPHALRLKKLFELMGYNPISEDGICEGGTFLKGTPPGSEGFLIVSYDLVENFEELKIPLLRSPPDIGTDTQNTHIDTYFGILNFKLSKVIDGKKYAGILYVHTNTLKKIQDDTAKRKVWNDLKEEMQTRKYLIHEYIPENTYQNIGINFKFDEANNTLLSNAIPKREQTFLKSLDISVLAPEFSFGTNDSISGGVNCSYLIIPDNESIQKYIISWIKKHTQIDHLNPKAMKGELNIFKV